MIARKSLFFAVAGLLVLGVPVGGSPASAAPESVSTPTATGAAAGTDAAEDAGATVSITPARVLDTRVGIGAAASAVAGLGSVRVSMLGVAGVPAQGVSAVVVTLTVTDAESGGFLTVYPEGDPVPGTSNVNFAAGVTVANMAVVPVGVDGAIRVHNGSPGAAAVIVDVSGYVVAGTPTDAGTFSAVPADRVLDTRAGPGPVAGLGSVRVFMLGVAGVPAQGVSAVVVTLTSTDAQSGGFLAVYPEGDSLPGTSNMNFDAGVTVANTAVVPVGGDGSIRVHNGSPGAVQVIVDVTGYYLTGTAAAAGSYVPVPSGRLVDTRTSAGAAPVAAQDAVTVDVLDVAGVPAQGVAAVLVTITATGAPAAGYLTAYAAGAALPPTSNVNFAAGATAAGLAIVQVGADGRIAIHNGAPDTVQVIVDISGYYLQAPVSTTLSWGAAASVDPSLGGALRDVSCPTTTFCVAVDNGGRALSYDGSSWTEPAQIAPEISGLTGVSCPTASFCLAVDYFGRVSSFDGSTWAPPVEVDGGAQAGGFTAVSCSSATFCVAMTSYGYAATFDGTSWTGPVGIAGYDADFSAVSCTSPTFCVAVDWQGNALTFDGTQWSATTIADNLADVSCTSPTFCVAVDNTSAITFDGTAWGAPVVVAPLGGLGEVDCVSPVFCAAFGFWGEQSTFNGTAWTEPAASDPDVVGVVALSCADASLCVAVNYATDALIGRGDGWSANLDIDPDQGALWSVSCTSATFCMAVDLSGNALRFDGAGWSTPTEIAPTADGLRSVSCTSPTFCMAVDESRRAFEYDGTDWQPWTVTEPADYLVAVSCSSSSFCEAINGSAGAHTFDGAGWSGPMTVDAGPSSGLTGVSCASPTFCVAVGFAGYATRFDGASWTGRAFVPVTDPEFVSCPSASFCAVIGGSNEVSTFDGSTWLQPDVVTSDEYTVLEAISCASATFCVAVDSDQQSTQFDGISWAEPVPTQQWLSSISCPSSTFCMALTTDGNAVQGCVCAPASVPSAVAADGTAGSMTAEERARLFGQRTSTWTSQRDGIWRWDGTVR